MDHIAAMQAEWLHKHGQNTRWIIIETPKGYEVHMHMADGIAPASLYRNKQLAAARVIQLLGIGPVAPQSYPEEVCIGETLTPGSV